MQTASLEGFTKNSKGVVSTTLILRLTFRTNGNGTTQMETKHPTICKRFNKCFVLRNFFRIVIHVASKLHFLPSNKTPSDLQSSYYLNF